MHCTALPFVQYIAQTNSNLTIPDSWLHKMARTHEIGSDGVGEFSLMSLHFPNDFELNSEFYYGKIFF